MGKSNIEQLAIAKKHLNEGGARFRKFCGMRAGAYCNAYVCYVFNEAENASLFYGGKKVTYCPTSIKWCYKNLASIPIYLAMPSDIIYFDWELNGVPNHIGFVDHRISDLKIATVEGNTSKTDEKGKVLATGVVAKKVRTAPYIQAVFRPHYKATYKIAKLKIDGAFEYNSIAMLQLVLGLKVDGILGLKTIKALQKKVGVEQDGSWGTKTTKAVQKMVGTEVDGYWGVNSTKALQKWVNNEYTKITTSKKETTKKTEPKKETQKKVGKTLGDKIADTAESYVGKVKYVKGGTSLKTGCDCTGFVQAVHKKHGITLKVSESWGKSVGKNISKALAGDVIYYYVGGKLHHMGIYVGNNNVVHNSTSHKDWHKDCCKSNVKLSGMSIGDIRRCWK